MFIIKQKLDQIVKETERNIQRLHKVKVIGNYKIEEETQRVIISFATDTKFKRFIYPLDEKQIPHSIIDVVSEAFLF